MSEPSWLASARVYLGVTEIPGRDTAPLIRRWLRELRAWWDSDDEIPMVRHLRSRRAASRSWRPLPQPGYRARAWLGTGGLPCRSPPRPGCVVVYERAPAGTSDSSSARTPPGGC